MLPPIRFIIFFGLFIRLLVSIKNGFFDFEFGHFADPGSFHGFAVEFSKNPTVATCEEKIRHVMSCGLGAIYFLTTDSFFIGSLMSNFAWWASALILWKIMGILSIEKSNQRKIMFIYALLPSSIVITSVTLREPYQLLFVNLGVFSALKIYWEKSGIHWLTMFFSVYFMGLLHGGLMLFGIYILVATLILLARRRYKTGFNKIKLAFFVPIFVLIVSLGLEALFNSEKGYGNLDDGLAAGIEKYQKGGVNSALRAGSPATYRHTVDIKSNSDLIFFIPNALFQYWFEPMPWRINRTMDVGLFIENLLRMFLIWKALVGFRNISGGRRNLMIFVFLSYLALEVIFSQGTMNWGTSMRHHIPSFGLLVLAAYTYSKPVRHRIKSLTSVNAGLAPEGKI